MEKNEYLNRTKCYEYVVDLFREKLWNLENKYIEEYKPCNVGDKIEFKDQSGKSVRGVVRRFYEHDGIVMPHVNLLNSRGQESRSKYTTVENVDSIKIIKNNDRRTI